MDTELVEIWRGEMCESVHRGHAVICDGSGQVVEAWGDPDAVIYPRSSAKPLQALALVESGAAERLPTERLALACASHSGAAIHTDRVRSWMSEMGLGDDDFRCGPQEPGDIVARDALIRAGEAPCRAHNNCSGKHAGFLHLSQHLGGDAEYLEIDHPVQVAVRAAFEEVTGEDSPRWAIDGCSAPNHACTVSGLARAAARFATATEGSVRGRAMLRLREAMITHPELIAGEDRACTRLMRATSFPAAIKGGAEGVYFAALPDQGLGIALKISDGASRASEMALATLLVRHRVADPRVAEIAAFASPPIKNLAGIVTGEMRPSPSLRGMALGRLG